MKKLCILLIMALMLGIAPAHADKHHGRKHGPGPRVEHREHREHRKDHPSPPRPKHHNPPRPERPPKHRPAPQYYSRPAGISVSLGPLQMVMTTGGTYYREVMPGRYAVERPPMGMIVPRIPHGRRVRHHGQYCTLVQGVLYLPFGSGFKVVGYM